MCKLWSARFIAMTHSHKFSYTGFWIVAAVCTSFDCKLSQALMCLIRLSEQAQPTQAWAKNCIIQYEQWCAVVCPSRMWGSHKQYVCVCICIQWAHPDISSRYCNVKSWTAHAHIRVLDLLLPNTCLLKSEVAMDQNGEPWCWEKRRGQQWVNRSTKWQSSQCR